MGRGGARGVAPGGGLGSWVHPSNLTASFVDSQGLCQPLAGLAWFSTLLKGTDPTVCPPLAPEFMEPTCRFPPA